MGDEARNVGFMGIVCVLLAAAIMGGPYVFIRYKDAYDHAHHTGEACAKVCAPLQVKVVHPTYDDWCVCESRS